MTCVVQPKQTGTMPVMIRLRHVPDDQHRKLKACAAVEGVPLSAYLIRLEK